MLSIPAMLRVYRVVALLGIAYVILVQWLLFPNHNNIFWLNLVVTVVVNLLIFVVPTFALKSKGSGSAALGSMGLLWVSIIAYITPALLGVVLFGLINISFLYAALFQGGLFILLIGVLTLVWLTASKISQTEQNEALLYDKLDRLREESSSLSVRSRQLSSAYNVQRERIDRLKDTFRYTSPCDGPKAARLENTLLAELTQLAEIVATAEAAMGGDAEKRKRIDVVLTSLEENADIRRACRR